MIRYSLLHFKDYCKLQRKKKREAVCHMKRKTNKWHILTKKHWCIYCCKRVAFFFFLNFLTSPQTLCIHFHQYVNSEPRGRSRCCSLGTRSCLLQSWCPEVMPYLQGSLWYCLLRGKILLMLSETLYSLKYKIYSNDSNTTKV